jgi:predicted dehydrogenase
MRLGLIGATGHWTTYAPALGRIPGLELVAVAPAGPEETPGAFDHAPGLTPRTRRYEDARQMLDRERLDVAQVSARCDRIPHWSIACLERGLPVMAEKPLAMDLPTLEKLYGAARKAKVPVVPMHTMRAVPVLAAVRQAVRGGEVGDPLLSFSQKSYKWGKDRPEFYRQRATFPGIAPWVGIHAFDWLHWILGDVFVSIQGIERATARPDYPACPSQGAYLLTMASGGLAAVTLDYLRPESAASHGDERLRIAGTRGVVETALIERKAVLTQSDRPARPLPLEAPADLFTQFARSLLGQGPPPISLAEAFRITEIALKARQAAETGQMVSLKDSIYRAP